VQLTEKLAVAQSVCLERCACALGVVEVPVVDGDVDVVLPVVERDVEVVLPVVDGVELDVDERMVVDVVVLKVVVEVRMVVDVVVLKVVVVVRFVEVVVRFVVVVVRLVVEVVVGFFVVDVVEPFVVDFEVVLGVIEVEVLVVLGVIEVEVVLGVIVVDVVEVSALFTKKWVKRKLLLLIEIFGSTWSLFSWWSASWLRFPAEKFIVRAQNNLKSDIFTLIFCLFRI